MTIEQCWSREMIGEQARVANIRYSKVVKDNSTFSIETKVESIAPLGCFPRDNWFRVQIKDVATNQYIWESLRFMLCKDESILIISAVSMGSVDKILDIELCYDMTLIPNSLVDIKQIRVEVATPSKPPTDPVDELPPTTKGETDWGKMILYAAGIFAVAYIAATYIRGKK